MILQGLPAKPFGQVIAQLLGGHLVGQEEPSFSEPMPATQLKPAMVSKDDAGRIAVMLVVAETE